MTIAIIARIIFSLLLVWQVWHHAHWSVALCLTFVFIRIELEFWIEFTKQRLGGDITPANVDRAIEEWRKR